MITSYCSSFIRCLVAGDIIPQTEITRLLEINPNDFAKVLKGSNTSLNLEHIERLLKAFGMAALDANFFGVSYDNRYGRCDDSLALSVGKQAEMAAQLLELQAYRGNTGRTSRINTLIAQNFSNNAYLKSCEFILAEVGGVALEPEEVSV